MSDYIHWSLAGTGLSLRGCNVDEILSERPDVRWFEALVDAHIVDGGERLHNLERIREHYPVTLHGLGLALGSTSPLDTGYLVRIRALADRIDASWISDHICFTSLGNCFSHEVLPLPYTEEALDHIASRIMQVQDFLGRRILLENPARYLGYNHSTLSEGEFMAEMAERADCYLLLDVNNSYVTQHNLGADALDTIDCLPPQRVREIHLAGYDERDGCMLGGHNNPVREPVWALYEAAQKRFTGTPTLIEWEHDIPDLKDALRDVRRAKRVMHRAQNGLRKPAGVPAQGVRSPG
ncbi:UPF0276 protein [Marinobacterium nitratireducens]|uniref:UPF0276 protein n=1 Tax=Marinobacterium nitratireducens TaxID=518897 RepID=A0A917ZAI3_9GAMM|nr:DUF692 domain-containing protein [Marinobacterium nitratireducens]GGO79730.1 UPF0276 protein [Marinobacterium nitratireducens]